MFGLLNNPDNKLKIENVCFPEKDKEILINNCEYLIKNENRIYKNYLNKVELCDDEDNNHDKFIYYSLRYGFIV